MNGYTVVEVADADRDELRARGIAASDLDEQSCGTFVSFQDPDCNACTLQQLPSTQGNGHGHV